MIVKECLKKFHVDSNLIQILEKDEIDLDKLDKFISNENNFAAENMSRSRNKSNTKNVSDIENKTNSENIYHTGNESRDIYIYEDSENYRENVISAFEKLRGTDEYKDYNIVPIQGDFANVINFLNDRKPLAVCMYTDSSQKAYKLMNWVNSPNIFINVDVPKVSMEKCDNCYYELKFVLHKDVF